MNNNQSAWTNTQPFVVPGGVRGTQQIVAMGFPSEGHEAVYRNQMAEVQVSFHGQQLQPAHATTTTDLAYSRSPCGESLLQL